MARNQCFRGIFLILITSVCAPLNTQVPPPPRAMYTRRLTEAKGMAVFFQLLHFPPTTTQVPSHKVVASILQKSDVKQILISKSTLKDCIHIK